MGPSCFATSPVPLSLALAILSAVCVIRFSIRVTGCNNANKLTELEVREKGTGLVVKRLKPGIRNVRSSSLLSLPLSVPYGLLCIALVP